jgi:glycosyltransferase involved in cell wall biosynthesis
MHSAVTGMLLPDLEIAEAAAVPPGPRDGDVPRILIDLTTSWHWIGKHAVGILRTEREIARRLLDHDGIQTLPVVFHENAFRLISEEYARSLLVTADDPKAEPPTSAMEPAPAVAPAAPRRRFRPLAFCLRPFGFGARRAAPRLLGLLPARVAEEVRLSLIHARQAFRNLVYRQSADERAQFEALHAANIEADRLAALVPKPRPQPHAVLDLSLVVHPGARDVLFVCGLSWDVLNWPMIAELRRTTGLRVVAVMYDLIPIKHPEFVGGPQPVLQNCFLHMTDICDLIFCISACTQADYIEFVRDSGRPPVPTEIIYLGANVPAQPSLAALPDTKAQERLAGQRFALAVGTFEIRKNYALLVDLWEELLADPQFDLDLVIVGMPGWLVEDTMRRLEALPGFGTRIHWFNRLSDSGLSWLYENCHVFLFPSLYEGWGLPVAEALLHKSPTIASNRGATPEAAFGQALLLDPEDRAAWKQALIETAKAPRRIVTFDPAGLPTWEQTADTVARTLTRIAGEAVAGEVIAIEAGARA